MIDAKTRVRSFSRADVSGRVESRVLYSSPSGNLVSQHKSNNEDTRATQALVLHNKLTKSAQ